MKRKLLQLYYHFNQSKPLDRLELVAPIILMPLAVINFIIFSIYFFSKNAIYDINPQTYELILLANPEERLIIGNQLVAYLFLGLGWVIIPFLKSVYKHQLPTETCIFMALASLGLYSILLESMLLFALIIFLLLVKNTELGKRLSLIKENPKFKKLYTKLFPPILD